MVGVRYCLFMFYILINFFVLNCIWVGWRLRWIGWLWLILISGGIFNVGCEFVYIGMGRVIIVEVKFVCCKSWWWVKWRGLFIWYIRYLLL